MMGTHHIETAAKAWFDRGQADRRDDGRWRDDTQTQVWQWEDLTDHDRATYRAVMAPVADAIAAPILALHHSQPTKTHPITEDYECAGCGRSWPCPTAQLVGGA